MYPKIKMKGKEDADSDGAVGNVGTSSKCSGKNSAAFDSSMSSFIQQEKLCKELYLSMGVHPTDIADTSDDDVASILEQMSRLHPSVQEKGGGSERNIEDILREAECLLDGQHIHPQSRSKSSSISSKSESEASGTSEQRLPNTTNLVPKCDDITAEPPALASLRQNQRETFLPPHLIGTPLEATYKRIYDQIKKEVDGTLKPQLTGDFPDFKLSLPIPGIDTPSFDVPGCFNLEQEFLEERKRCLKLKADLDWLKKQHEREVTELRRRHEGQLNQVREELSTTINQEPSIALLRSEIKAQERIISGYQDENEKMCAELKDMKRVLLKLMALLKADKDYDSVFVYP